LKNEEKQYSNRMDASQITKLREKQQVQYINRNNSVDSSTMIWRNQIQSSKYIKGTTTCTGLQQTSIPTEPVCSNGNGTFSFGGGKEMSLATGSLQKYPSVFRGASGSASETYSSDKILLQKAGNAYCAGTTAQALYTVLPVCDCTNTNEPVFNNVSTVNNKTNQYLPSFDTYYNLKNPCFPSIDQNKKHYVQKCCVSTICNRN
jgi:hypothetical protein